MAVPTATLWSRDPHTAAKHQILKWYLQAWFPILGKYNGRIVYFEGFAGPGEYEGAEPGSPLVALDVALEQSAYLSKEIVFYLVEANAARAEHLRSRIAERRKEGLPPGFSFEVRHAEFASELESVLDELDRDGLAPGPMFAFIDPFGFKGLPMALIHRLLRFPQTEAFINFAVDPINRFIEHPNEEINAQMVNLFGTEEALTLSGADSLRQLYQRQLGQVARHVRFFTMYRSDGKPIYDLFFASNHSLGLEKMKEAMWRVDPDGAFRFSDQTDPTQAVLFDSSAFDPTAVLTKILARFDGETDIPVKKIERWTLEETPYVGKHMREALKLGEQQHAFTVHPTKRDGAKRRGTTFPLEVLISFVNPPTTPQPAQPTLFE